MTAEGTPAPALTLVGQDAPVCVDGVCTIPGQPSSAGSEPHETAEDPSALGTRTG